MKNFVRQNVGAFDQWLRYALGFVMLFTAAAGIIGPWGYLGVIPLATAMFRFCPLYRLLGITTCKRTTGS